jgi:hypothetical protein
LRHSRSSAQVCGVLDLVIVHRIAFSLSMDLLLPFTQLYFYGPHLNGNTLT